MKKIEVKPCPFCGKFPKIKGNTVIHVSPDDYICIVDDTQYDLDKWNKRI